MKPEPEVQPRLRVLTAVMSLAIVATLVLAHSLFVDLPDRVPREPAMASIRFEPVQLDEDAFLPLRLVGAWKVTSDDPRVGAVSGLAVDGRDLIALTDSGVVVRFEKPGGPRARARVHDLPAGPGGPRHKWNRDSEALAPDPAGRGWWVAFENRDSLWLYDGGFERALSWVSIPADGFEWNIGIEGLATAGGELLLLPEAGGRALVPAPSGWAQRRFDFRARRVSGAAALSDNSLLAIERRLTLWGFANALVRLERCSDGYCLAWRKSLPLDWYDNLEAIAAEPLESGATRLWMMTDNNLRLPLRSVLIAVDLPPQS